MTRLEKSLTGMIKMPRNDWTGSAAQRRPQGTCATPYQPSEVKCDWITAGTPVKVRPKRGTRKKWRTHTTKVDVPITETIKRTHKTVLFIQDEWVVCVDTVHIRTSQVPSQRHRAPEGSEQG